MRLKVITTTLLLAGILLMLAWPKVYGQKPPPEATRKVKALWGQKVILYFGLASSVWLSTAMSAFLLARQSRKEFLKQESENLKSLIEGTLKDHDRKS